MFIPYGTDAPIYHRPIGTVTVIIFNFVVFLATEMGVVYGNPVSDYRWLILEYDRINPLQWVTAAFMHANWMHLIGNMIFLWCFGIVVEGKIGWQKFAWLYLVLCLADGAIAQIPMFIFYGESIGGALGASGVIYALMVVSLVWAPANDLNCIYCWSVFFVGHADIPIAAFAVFYIGKEFLPLILFGFHISTPLLHLLGALVGFPAAAFMLKRNLVDCEGWDLFSRFGNSTQSRKRSSPTRMEFGSYDGGPEREQGRRALEEIYANPDAFNPVAAQQHQVVADREQKQHALKNFTVAVEGKLSYTAKVAFQEIREKWGTHTIGEVLLVRYARLLANSGKHLDSLEPLQVLVSRRSKARNQACIRIAQIQFPLQGEPAAAKATLRQMAAPISDVDQKRRRKLLVELQRQSLGGGRFAQNSIEC